MHVLDLDKERLVFVRLLTNAIRAFREATPRPLALPVTRVDINFDLTSMERPCVWVHLDTEPNGEPDSGKSETYELLEWWREHWAPACQAVEDDPVTVRRLGRSIPINTEEQLDTAVGEFFVDVITSLRDQGVFKALPRGTPCYLGVSATGGWFGWPAWEDRGPGNMV